MNFYSKWFWMVLLKLLPVTVLWAKNNDSIASYSCFDKAVYFDFGPNASTFYLRDEGTSPLIYHGLLYGGQLGSTAFRKNRISQIEYTFSYGKLQTRNFAKDQNKATSYCNTLYLNFALQVFEGAKKNFKVFIGPSLNVIGNFRANPKFDNASFNYEVISSMGPVFYLENRFQLKKYSIQSNQLYHKGLNKEFLLLNSFFIPVFSGIIRPTYSVIEDFPDITKQAFNRKNIYYKTIPQYLGLTFRSQLFFTLHPRVITRLGYEWYFYSLHPGQNNLQGVYSNLSFAFLFRLTK